MKLSTLILTFFLFCYLWRLVFEMISYKKQNSYCTILFTTITWLPKGILDSTEGNFEHQPFYMPILNVISWILFDFGNKLMPLKMTHVAHETHILNEFTSQCGNLIIFPSLTSYVWLIWRIENVYINGHIGNVLNQSSNPLFNKALNLQKKISYKG